MKRYHAPKRRDRRSGESPYHKRHKVPFAYSPSYREFFHEVTGKTKTFNASSFASTSARRQVVALGGSQ